jgi:hypothetical protein
VQPSISAETDTAAERHWRRVLGRLDRSRKRAWREGRPDLLRKVWTTTSTGLRADQRMLRTWTRRGLAVDGVSMVLDRLTLVERLPRRVVLRAVDHLGPVVARRRTAGRGHPPADGGPRTATATASRALPVDRPSRHRLTLVRTDSGWRLSEVRTIG